MKVAIMAGLMAVVMAGCTPEINRALMGGEASPSPAMEDVQQDAQDALNQVDNTLETNTQVRTVTLQEQNNSGQSGTAVLTELDDNRLMVVLNMTGGNFPQPQPAHIHVGSCPTSGAVQYPLNNVVNGQSETTLDMSMDEVMNSSETLAINVHQSTAEVNVYTACGDLK